MLADRVLKPKADDLIFHYCSAQGFKDIIESGKLRFGDLNLMNDYGESQYGYGMFEAGATKVLGDVKGKKNFATLDVAFVDKMDERISPAQLFTHNYATSFSRDGDLLSQWRGYADDAAGFSIGFSAADLKKHMPVTLLEVCYDPAQQAQEMATAIGGCWQEQKENNFPFGDEFRDYCGVLSSTMYAFKAPAFAEEKEVRAIHAVKVEITADHQRFVDEGGTADGKDVPGEPIHFRVRKGVISSYLDIPFRRVPEHQPIKQVILGPKNENGAGNVLFLLGNNGYKHVDIKRAAATYG